jgi:hypothetical protein
MEARATKIDYQKIYSSRLLQISGSFREVTCAHHSASRARGLSGRLPRAVVHFSAHINLFLIEELAILRDVPFSLPFIVHRCRGLAVPIGTT